MARLVLDSQDKKQIRISLRTIVTMVKRGNHMYFGFTKKEHFSEKTHWGGWFDKTDGEDSGYILPYRIYINSLNTFNIEVDNGWASNPAIISFMRDILNEHAKTVL